MKVAVLIPAYNTATWIEEVVRSSRNQCPQVLVVDDGSKDATASLAWKAGAEVVRHPGNRGKGAALRTGFRCLLQEEWEAVITLDADGQHDPSDISRFLEVAEKGGAGIVIGSRLAHMQGMRRIRRFFNHLSTRFISLLCGQEIEDTQSGYRLIRTDILRKFPTRCSRYDLEAELLIRASRAGYSIMTIPIAVPRIDGLSSSHYRPFLDTYLIGLLILRQLWRK